MSEQDGSGERSEPGFFAPQARKNAEFPLENVILSQDLLRKSTWKRRRNTCASRQMPQASLAPRSGALR